MEIEISSRPVFLLQMTRQAVLLLQDLALHHYDGRCIGAGKCGGFIYGWVNHLTMGDEASQVQQVKAEPDQMDTMMKIMEMPPPGLPTAQVLVIVDLRKSITDAMQQAKIWAMPNVPVVPT